MKLSAKQRASAMGRTALAIIFTVLSVSSISGSVSAADNFGIRSDNTLCLKDMRNWKKYPGWKAIALTRTVGIAQGCGTVGAFESRAEAKKQALKACNANVKYPVFQGRTGCHIVAIGK